MSASQISDHSPNTAIVAKTTLTLVHTQTRGFLGVFLVIYASSCGPGRRWTAQTQRTSPPTNKKAAAPATARSLPAKLSRLETTPANSMRYVTVRNIFIVSVMVRDEAGCRESKWLLWLSTL